MDNKRKSDDSNFAPRAIAAMAGNGAIIATLANYLANNDLQPGQPRLIGLVSALALIGLVLGYLSLGWEREKRTWARVALRWSAVTFLASMIGYVVALCIA